MRTRRFLFICVVGILGAVDTAVADDVGEGHDALPPGAVGRLGTLRFRCRDHINCVAFSPDGKYVAAGGGAHFKDYAIDLWNSVTGRLAHRFVGHHDRVWDLAFTPDGTTLISGGADGVRYWDVCKGTMIRWTRTTGIVLALAISPDRRICAVGTSEGAIHLWSQNGQLLIGSIKSPAEVEALKFSPDDRWLVSTGWDLKSRETVRFWDVATRKKLWELRGQELETFWRDTVAFSSNGLLFAQGTDQGQIQIWNTRQRQMVRAISGTDKGRRARVLGFAAKDALLFSQGHGGEICIWDVKSGKLKEKFNALFTWQVALSPDARTIAYGNGATVKLWDIVAREHRHELPGHHSTIRSIAFSPDGKVLASSAHDHTVRLWEIQSQKELRQWHTGADNHAWQVSFSADGKTLLTANWQYVELRDTSTGKLTGSLGTGKSWALTEARMLPDQQTLVTVDSKRAQVWSIKERRELRTIMGPYDGIDATAISADGRLVAFSRGNRLWVWETPTGKRTAQLDSDAVSTPTFSSDGRHLAWTGLAGMIFVWDVDRMEMRHRLRTRDDIQALAFDRSGRYLASAGSGSRIRLWDMKKGIATGEFFSPRGRILCLAFSSTADILASAGDDGTVTLWDLHKKVLPPPPPPPTDELLPKLLTAYRVYDLPTPPADAKLVRFSIAGNENRSLGLLIEPKKGQKGRARLWHRDNWGIDWSELAEFKFELVKPVPEALGNASLWDEPLLAAIHCKALGWHAMAKALFESSTGIMPEFADDDLAASAWYYWTSKLQIPEEDRAEIARRLRALVNASPKRFAEYQKDLLRSLELALVPSTAKAGSLQALIDDLVEVRSTRHSRLGAEPDAGYTRLALRGFDAVPTLIEHLEDDRLTKTYRAPFNNFGGFHYRVADIVTELLQDLAGDSLGAWRLRGDTLDKATALAWWSEASKLGEEAYLVGHVLGEQDAAWPNEVMLEIITQKYPAQLSKIYREMLRERPKMTGRLVARAIAVSSLPLEQKRALLRLGLAHQDAEHRRDAQHYLDELKRK